MHSYEARLGKLEEQVRGLAHLEARDLRRDEETRRKLQRMNEQIETIRRLVVDLVNRPQPPCNPLLDQALNRLSASVDALTAAMSGNTGSTDGHFVIHVTAVEFKEDTMSPAAVDHTPALDLAASSVRAKLSVVGPKNSAGTYLTSAEVTWAVSDETEPGALVLEAAPDEFAMEVDGTTPILDANGQQIPIYSTFVNTPLEPAEGVRVGGLVTVSGPGMASADKKVTYGNAAQGHFTLIGGEAAEVVV